jgi:hypothetical protein
MEGGMQLAEEEALFPEDEFDNGKSNVRQLY